MVGKHLLFDTVVGAGLVYLLLQYTELSFTASLGVGMGVFWLLHGLRTRPKQQFMQVTSRHKAVVCERFGPVERVLKIEL